MNGLAPFQNAFKYLSIYHPGSKYYVKMVLGLEKANIADYTLLFG